MSKRDPGSVSKRSAASSERSGLTGDIVVAVASDIVAREGVEGLTMRGLARLLGVTQMAAYHWVGNKEQLLQLVTDHVESQVSIPEEDCGPWNVRLATLMRDHIAAFSKYPGLGAFIVNYPTEGVTRTNSTRIARAKFDILMQAGLTFDDAMLAYAALVSYMVGRFVVVDVHEHVQPSLRLEAVMGLPPVFRWRGEDYVDFAIDTILIGIADKFGLPYEREG